MKERGVYIITGATGGLGSALAEAAYRAGNPVALIARTKSKLDQLKKDLQSGHPKGPKISIHELDLTKENDVTKEFAAIHKTHGAIRALVNNAATWMGRSTTEKLTASDIQKSLDLNFFSAFHASMATIRLTGAEPKNELAIINVGATASLDSWFEFLPFSLAKSALRNFSRALGRELGPKGVHVAHLVIDGMLDNDRTRKLNPKLAENRFIKGSSVADSIIHVINQDRSCWTMEWDVRPYNENW